MKFTTMTGRLGIGLLLAGFLAAGGGLAWKAWVQDAPKISRDPVAPDPLPASPLEPDLESRLPAGAFVHIGMRNLAPLLQDFKSSNLFQAYSAIQASNEKSLAERLLAGRILVAIYPPEGAVLPVSQMPSGIGPKLPPALLLARVPPDVTLQSLFSGFLVQNVTRHRDVPIFIMAFGLLAASLPEKESSFFIIGNDLEKIKACIDLSQDPAKNAAQTDWVRQAFKRIPSDAFLYTLTKDDALKNLNLGLKDLPSFTDWSVASFSWDRGLKSSGFGHLAPMKDSPYKDLAAAGPASYEMLAFIPKSARLVLATNSLPSEITVKILENHVGKIKSLPPSAAAWIRENASSLAQMLDDQAALAYNGFQGTADSLNQDVLLVLQFRSIFRARLALWRMTNKYSGSGSAAGIFYALRGRWLVAATRKESLDAALKADSPAMFPAGLPAKSKCALVVDVMGLYQNLVASAPSNVLPQAQTLRSILELFSGFKRGGSVFMNASEGIFSQSQYPYEGESVEVWAARLKPFESQIRKYAVKKEVTQRKKVRKTSKKRSRISRSRRP